MEGKTLSKKPNNEKSNHTSREAKTLTRNAAIDARTWCIWGLYVAILNYFSLASGTTVCVSETLIDRKTFDPDKAHGSTPVVSDKDFETVMMALNSLTEKEKTILVLRFGLDYGTPRTLEEVGAMLGVTRERIRQLEAKALRKMRSPSRLCKLPALFGFIPPMNPVKDFGYLVDEYGRMDPHSKIEDLGLTVRAYNCLKRFAHIDTIDDILDYPKEDWPKIRNLGRKALEEVVEKMHFAGYEDFSVNASSEI